MRVTMNRSTAMGLTLIIPILLLLVPLRDQLFQKRAPPRAKSPCERVLDEAEIRATTGGRVRDPEVTIKEGRCTADWGAAEVKLGTYTKYTEGFEDLLASVSDRPGFVSSAKAGGTPPAVIVELRTRIADTPRKTKVILFDRGAGGWAEIALHFDGDAIAGLGRASIDALVWQIGRRLGEKETGIVAH